MCWSTQPTQSPQVPTSRDWRWLQGKRLRLITSHHILPHPSIPQHFAIPYLPPTLHHLLYSLTAPPAIPNSYLDFLSSYPIRSPTHPPNHHQPTRPLINSNNGRLHTRPNSRANQPYRHKKITHASRQVVREQSTHWTTAGVWLCGYDVCGDGALVSGECAGVD